MYSLYLHQPGATERRLCTAEAIADARAIAASLLAVRQATTVTIRDRHYRLVASYSTYRGCMVARAA